MRSSQLNGGSFGSASSLNGCLRNYFRSPETVAKDIAALLDHDQKQFYFDACRAVRSSDLSTPGARFLLGLMLQRGLLIRALCDSAVPEQRVCAIIQGLLEEDAGSDLALAKAVVTHAQSNQPASAGNPVLRVLNTLEGLADAKRIAPRLLPLLRHADPYLRSKAVRIIGRGGRNTQWVARQLGDPDPRVRANAVEALWGIDDQESRDLLKGAIQDANNRVVGNALIEIYRVGDCSSVPGLLKMAAEGSPLFRSTAAWAMGESGDNRFRDALKALAGEGNPNVRRRAALALGRVEAGSAKSVSGAVWHLAALRDFTECEGEDKRLRVAVRHAGGNQPSVIPGTQFRIFEDNRPVLDYKVEPLEVPDRLILAFLIPVMADGSEQPMIGGALRALTWKRPRDLWATVDYRPYRPWHLTATLIGQTIEIARPEEFPAELDTPVFTADPESAAQALEQASEGAAHSSIWDAIVEASHACAGVRAADAEPHLVIYSPCHTGTPSERQSERLAALDLTVPIHCIAWAADPLLEALCERSHGKYYLVAGDAEVAEIVESLSVRLLARYSVSYRGASDAASGQIQVHTPEGWGKAAVQSRPEWGDNG